MNKYRFLVVFWVFMASCHSNAIDRDANQDVIMKAHMEVINKNFEEAERLLKDLLDENELDEDDKISVIYRLLELSYIFHERKNSELYGDMLLKILDGKKGNLREKVLYRMCESKDWSSTREYFEQHCDQT